MKEILSRFIFQTDFPCIMAKSLFKKGNVQTYSIKDPLHPKTQKFVLERMYGFIEEFRRAPEKLSSFIVGLEVGKLSFPEFEKIFWKFLSDIYLLDKELYSHDSRVSADPYEGNFSFSIKEESFFILGLHPESPRKSRRFSIPTIVFNPHEQFERLRKEGVFKKIRTLIRRKDEELQGEKNPMLSDFGGRSEVFQYLGVTYPSGTEVPLKVR